jgi:Zn-dependent protease with chaperone function
MTAAIDRTDVLAALEAATREATASPITNREAWLHAFADAARPLFAAAGHPLPAALRIGVGWTSGGSRAANRVIGECYAPEASADGVRSIIISTGAGLPDAETVAAVLTHELAHAALPHSEGHGRKFRALALGALGLEGKATATVAGDNWRGWAAPILAALGPYPHAALMGGAKAKQPTRMIKALCGCGYTVRLSAKWASAGAPLCGVCEARMTCEGVDGADD